MTRNKMIASIVKGIDINPEEANRIFDVFYNILINSPHGTNVCKLFRLESYGRTRKSKRLVLANPEAQNAKGERIVTMKVNNIRDSIYHRVLTDGNLYITAKKEHVSRILQGHVCRFRIKDEEVVGDRIYANFVSYA